jgi:hypothetical protein
MLRAHSALWIVFPSRGNAYSWTELRPRGAAATPKVPPPKLVLALALKGAASPRTKRTPTPSSSTTVCSATAEAPPPLGRNRRR